MTTFGELSFHGIRLEVRNVYRSNSNQVCLNIVDAGDPERATELTLYLADLGQLETILAAFPKAANFYDADEREAARQRVIA